MSIPEMREIFEPYGKYLHDGKSFYTKEYIRSKDEKKINNAFKSYFKRSNPTIGDVVFYIDQTLFGSGDDGLCITDYAIAFRNFLDDEEFIYLRDLKRVRLDTDDCELVMNGKIYKYIHPEWNNKMQVVTDCLKQFISEM